MLYKLILLVKKTVIFLFYFIPLSFVSSVYAEEALLQDKAFSLLIGLKYADDSWNMQPEPPYDLSYNLQLQNSVALMFTTSRSGSEWGYAVNYFSHSVSASDSYTEFGNTIYAKTTNIKSSINFNELDFGMRRFFVDKSSSSRMFYYGGGLATVGYKVTFSGVSDVNGFHDIYGVGDQYSSMEEKTEYSDSGWGLWMNAGVGWTIYQNERKSNHHILSFDFHYSRVTATGNTVFPNQIGGATLSVAYTYLK